MINKVVAFAAVVVLARLLTPTEFGLVGYCSVGIIFFDVVSRFGLDQALISRRDRIEEASNVVFYLCLVNGAAFYGLAWLTAPYVAAFFREDAVVELFRVLSLVLLLSAFSTVQAALLQRDLRFRAALVPEAAQALVKGGVSIALALAGLGAWSLVWGQLAGVLSTTIVLWFIVSWRPSFRFHYATAREVLRFGAHMVGAALIAALRGNIDHILIGRFLGSNALGVFVVAARLPDLLVRSLNRVTGRVAYPTMSQLQNDPARLERYYAAYVRYVAVLTLPAGVGLAVIAQPFVLTLYTEKWATAVFPMQCIAIALAISSIGFVPGALYKAINRPEILTAVSFFKLPVLAVVLWYATHYGLNGVALAHVFLASFFVMVDSVVVSRIIGFGFRQLLSSLAPALAAASVMGAITGLVAWGSASDDALELMLLVGLGIVLYSAALRIVSRQIYIQIVKLCKIPQSGCGATP
jgi:PST family polysaccharide transporter